MKQWIADRLTRNACFAHKMWSFRLAVFWGVMQGLWVCFPVIQDKVPPIEFVCVGVVMSVLIAVARVTHQPGVE